MPGDALDCLRVVPERVRQSSQKPDIRIVHRELVEFQHSFDQSHGVGAIMGFLYVFEEVFRDGSLFRVLDPANAAQPVKVSGPTDKLDTLRNPFTRWDDISVAFFHHFFVVGGGEEVAGVAGGFELEDPALAVRVFVYFLGAVFERRIDFDDFASYGRV